MRFYQQKSHVLTTNYIKLKTNPDLLDRYTKSSLEKYTYPFEIWNVNLQA